jgi:hypothetical protein
MGTLSLSLPPTIVPQLPAGVSRKLMRRLIVGTDLGVGSRVLVTGRAADDMVEFLVRLGLSAAALTGSADQPATTDTSREKQIRCQRETELTADELTWDLVLGLGLDAYEGSLLAAEALHTTADLLASLRPLGRLILLVPIHGDGCAAGGHAASCFVRHMSSFAGAVEISGVTDGLVGVDPLGWIVGRRPRQDHLLAGLRTPEAAPSRFGWHEQAEAAVRAEGCCRLRSASVRSAA